MSAQKRIILGACAVGAVLAITWVVREFYPFDGTYHVRTLQLSAGRSIEIRADTCWEISQGVEYRIQGSSQNGMLGFTTKRPGTLDFRVLSAERGDLVAIVEAANPDVVLMLHDFLNNHSWSEDKADGEAMLRRLQPEHPDVRLVLSSSVPGSRNLKIR